MALRVKTELDGVYKKFGEQNITKGRRAMANQMFADMNRFVPRKEGVLRMNASISIDGQYIYYHQPYAQAQFKIQHSNYTTPNTGPRWDKAGWNAHSRKWKNRFLKGADF